MRTYSKTIAAMAVASAFAAGNASAEVEYQLHTGYTNEYIFRGLDLGHDLVEAGAAVAGEYNGFGLTAAAWYGSFSDSTGDSNELDLTAAASYTYNAFTGSVGYIWYDNYLNTQEDSQEIFARVATNFYGFDTSFTYFWDVDQDNDGYSELALGYRWELNSCLSLNTSAILAYLFEQGELAHTTAKVALDYQFRPNATLSPFVAHSWALTEDGNYQGSNNELFGGAMLTVGF